MKEPVNHTLYHRPISRKREGKEGLEGLNVATETLREESVGGRGGGGGREKERQTKKMTERKRAREEHCHVRSVSDFNFFSFPCVRMLQLYKVMNAEFLV